MKKKRPWYLLGVIRVFLVKMLEHALIAGLLSVGIRVYKLGVIATPGVAYLVRTEKASAGVMISASHNPALDNGIKFFGGDGFKLDDDRELEIEALLDAAEDTLPRPSAQGLGTVMEYPEGLRKYQEFLVSTGVQLEGMHVVLDTAMVQPLLVRVKSLQIWELN